MQKSIVFAAIVKNIPPNAFWHRKEKLLNMKYLAIIALAVLAIGLGACESNKPAASTSTTTSGSSSYRK